MKYSIGPSSQCEARWSCPPAPRASTHKVYHFQAVISLYGGLRPAGPRDYFQIPLNRHPVGGKLQPPE